MIKFCKPIFIYNFTEETKTFLFYQNTKGLIKNINYFAYRKNHIGY